MQESTDQLLQRSVTGMNFSPDHHDKPINGDESAPRESSEGCPSLNTLRGWIEGSSLPSRIQRQHLEQCESCRTQLDQATDSPELFVKLKKPADSRSFEHEVEIKNLLRNNLREFADASPTKAVLATVGEAAQSTSISTYSPTSLPSLAELASRMPDDRFRLQRLLGKGGVGIVVLAYDSQTQSDVAIKFLHRSNLADRQRFQREIQILQDLDHENIIRIHSVGCLKPPMGLSVESLPEEVALEYLVMEYIAGGSASQIPALVRPSWKALARMVAGAARGIQSVHDHGLVHRDIKPANLLIDATTDTLKVADFGLAKSGIEEGATVTRSGDILGTPVFMSPEQVVEEVRSKVTQKRPAATHLTDVYSLGATLYVMLTGRMPWQGNIAAILRQIVDAEPTAPRLHNPRIPEPLATICTKAMSKTPKFRYSSMQAMAADLESFADGKPITARPASTMQRLSIWAGKNRGLAASAATIATLLVGIAFASVITSGVLLRQRAEILTEREQKLRDLGLAVATAAPEAVPFVVGQLDGQKEQILPFLEAQFSNATGLRARLNLACALAMLGQGREDFIVNSVGESLTQPGQCSALHAALATNRSRSLELLHDQVANTVEPEELCKLSILSALLGDFSIFSTIAQSNPDTRTRLIHTIPQWHPDINLLIRLIAQTDNPDTTTVLLLGLGNIPLPAFSIEQITALKAAVDDLETRETTSGVDGALQWIARKLQLEPFYPTETQGNAGSAEDGFWTTPQRLADSSSPGFTMRRIRAGRFTMGNTDLSNQYPGRTPHEVQLTRDFWLADREVSVGLFRQFAQDSQRPEAESSGFSLRDWEPDRVISPTAFHPAQQVSWMGAASFCNWLSELHGFEPYYGASEMVSVRQQDGTEISVEDRRVNMQATGYRLPSEAEFEFACRAGTATIYHFGDSQNYFDRYAAWSNATRIAAAPCGALMPNPWGLFDMHGNVWEHCEDWYVDLDSDEPVADPVNREVVTTGRVYRGGGVNTYTGYPDSSSRGRALPRNTLNNVGFRVARNFFEADTP